MKKDNMRKIKYNRKRAVRNRNVKKNSKNIKKIVRNLIFLIFIIILILFVYTTVKSRLSIKNNNLKKVDTEDKKIKKVETVEEKLKEKKSEVKELKLEDKIKNIDNQLNSVNTILKQQLNTFIQNNNLGKDFIQIGYIQPDSKREIKFNDKNLIPMKNNNVFIMAMIVEDLERENIIDLNKVIDISKFTEKKDEKISLSELVDKMVYEGKTWMIDLVKSEIELNAKSEWKTLANKKYGLSIDVNYNYMSVSDLINIIKRLLIKENYTYKYNKTIKSIMKKSNENNRGNIVENSYQYTLEIGFDLNNLNFSYIIYYEDSNISILNGVKNLLNLWHQDINN